LANSVSSAATREIHHDAPPFCKLDGADEMRGLNVKGLRGGGLPMGYCSAGRSLWPAFRKGARDALRDSVESFDVQNGLNPHVKHMVEFLRQRDLGRHGRIQQGMR